MASTARCTSSAHGQHRHAARHAPPRLHQVHLLACSVRLRVIIEFGLQARYLPFGDPTLQLGRQLLTNARFETRLLAGLARSGTVRRSLRRPSASRLPLCQCHVLSNRLTHWRTGWPSHEGYPSPGAKPSSPPISLIVNLFLFHISCCFVFSVLLYRANCIPSAGLCLPDDEDRRTPVHFRQPRPTASRRTGRVTDRLRRER